MRRIFIIFMVSILTIYLNCSRKEKAEEERIRITIEQKKEEPKKETETRTATRLKIPEKSKEKREVYVPPSPPSPPPERVAKRRPVEGEPSLSDSKRRLEYERRYMIKKGILPGDIPGVREDLTRARDLILSDRYREASELLDNVHEKVEKTRIDKKFIDKKIERLAFILKQRFPPDEAEERLQRFRGKIGDAYDSGNYEKVNKVLNKVILRLKGREKDFDEG